MLPKRALSLHAEFHLCRSCRSSVDWYSCWNLKSAEETLQQWHLAKFNAWWHAGFEGRDVKDSNHWDCSNATVHKCLTA